MSALLEPKRSFDLSVSSSVSTSATGKTRQTRVLWCFAMQSCKEQRLTIPKAFYTSVLSPLSSPLNGCKALKRKKKKPRSMSRAQTVLFLPNFSRIYLIEDSVRVLLL